MLLAGEPPARLAFPRQEGSGLYLNVIARAAGPDWYPTTIGLPIRALPGARSYPLLANARLQFGRPWTTITMPASILDRPMPRQGGHGGDVVCADWSSTAPASDVGGALQQVIMSMLPDGYPHVRYVADVVGMSARTLQRRLKDEGATFAGAVATTRFAEARRLLREPDRKVIDVALDLGYSDPAHFTRAFGRWAGVTPREFRRRSLGAAGAR